MIRLAIRVRHEQAELVLAELLELAPSGVEEVALPGGITEYAVYGAPGELPTMPDVTAAAAGALVEVVTTEVADNWGERWKDFHRPLVIGDELTVRPPWEPRGTTRLDVVIDPGQAFGTGSHATTSLCLELLLGLEPRGSLLDLGCGSGVLALAGARRGYAPVTALDNDPAAVSATIDNARVNGIALDVKRFDLRSEALPRAETMLANLLGPLLLALAAGLDASTAPSVLIASGLLREEADGIIEAFAPLGLRLTAQRERGEWAALQLSRSGNRDGPG